MASEVAMEPRAASKYRFGRFWPPKASRPIAFEKLHDERIGNMKESKLFSEYELRGVRLKNRIVASPMWQYAGQKGHATDWHLMNLGRLAEGGAGLVIQEGTTIERRGCGTLGDLGIWDDAYVPGLKRLVSMIKSNGATPGIQLMHCGRRARQKPPFEGRGLLERTSDIADWDDWEIVAPSAIPLSDAHPIPRELTSDEIRDVQNAWVAAARRAAEGGYEVLNLHGAHGYLIHQFLSPLANRRSDQYGGSFNNRIRFLMEVVEGIRTVWPQDRPIMVRLSVVAEDWPIEDSVALVKELKKVGVDMIDCSSGGLRGSPLLTKGIKLGYGYQVPLAAHIRRETGVPTTAVGLIVHANQAEGILTDEAADLVAIGRELIYNPNWPIDAAQKLGIDPDFNVAQGRARFWLERRAASVPDLKPSTFAS
jgi:2,4-dienoyl-CoA reductase-like NADH-dependent reductase (Old Yellow Enzyme family)